MISEGAETVSMKVYSAKAGSAVRLKLEDASNGNIAVELDATTGSSGTWETLTWDLSSASGLNHANAYDKASVFFDFGNTGDDSVYYADDIIFGGYTV